MELEERNYDSARLVTASQKTKDPPNDPKSIRNIALLYLTNKSLYVKGKSNNFFSKQ